MAGRLAKLGKERNCEGSLQVISPVSVAEHFDPLGSAILGRVVAGNQPWLDYRFCFENLFQETVHLIVTVGATSQSILVRHIDMDFGRAAASEQDVFCLDRFEAELQPF